MDNTTHTVQPGETLSGIASHYNISAWERIAELNGITDATTLQIGQVLKLPSDTGSANDDAAAPAEQTAAELAPVRSWCLPFSTTAPSTDEVARYMKALQNEEHGFYGLGKNGCWHGGVHFSRALNAENSVHCIADGEIIAWRFNQDNEKITSGKDTAHYSTNFVLVRHRLELPNEKKETQDFYSLYMHLASLSESRDNARPTAFDPNKNKGTINVPNSPIAITAGELLGYIGQFSTGANNADTLHLEVFADTSLKQFINAGRHYDTTLPANQKPWLIVGPGAQTAKARPSDTTLKNALHTGKGAAGWALVQPCAKGIVLHKDVLTGFNNNSYQNNNRVREAVSRQSGVDENLLTSERAYWDGYYYDENWVRNTEATHFDANFGARNNASATHRGILLPHGDPVWINAPIQEKDTLHDAENIEAWHFPFSTDTLEGPEATDTAILFVSDIEASLEEQRDGETIHWYQVTYTTEDGLHTGWVCSQGQRHVSLHSQWGWPGFEVVDNTQLTLDQYFARQMLAGNNVTEEEKSTFQAPAQAVETGPIFERIYQLSYKEDDTLLSPHDIPKLMNQPNVQQGLSRLIIEQPTEWQSSKPWSCLDEYMHDEAKPGWDATKEQIDKLAWWDEVNTQAKLNLGSTVMNVHPVALVEIFLSKGIFLEEVQLLALRISGGYEGKGNLDYHALADDFDGQGTSFGLIQWNFGQNTLGPILLKMYKHNPILFEKCFPDKTNYSDLLKSLTNQSQQDQLSWARNILRENRLGWSLIFKNIGDQEPFQKIQLEAALEYHKNVLTCLKELKNIAPKLMLKTSIITYVALYDLCVQQGTINKNDTIKNIKLRYSSENPKTQKDLITIVVQERAKTASKRWQADAMSRRMGIIEGRPYYAKESGYSATRNNPNFHMLEKYEGKYIYETL